jgi:5-methylcytosine-specific restriction enzyme A
MPRAPRRPCTQPGCPYTTEKGGLCDLHRKEQVGRYEQQRGHSASRGYNEKWRQAREAYLREHPLCAKCRENGRLEPATVGDHVKPHKGDPNLFWNRENWQPLCKRCHDAKTATHDGRWGQANHTRAVGSARPGSS